MPVEERQRGRKYIERTAQAQSGSNHQAAVRESPMADDRAAVAIGRQQGRKPAAVVENQQRRITKAVPVVFHVVAVKQESSVAASSHELVPRLLVLRRIWFHPHISPAPHSQNRSRHGGCRCKTCSAGPEHRRHKGNRSFLSPNRRPTDRFPLPGPCAPTTARQWIQRSRGDTAVCATG